MFDCLHDMGDPVGAARHVLETLAPDGTWMIVEPAAGDRVEDNLNPVGRAYYGFSTLLCTPASLSQDVGLALGAQAGPARIREVTDEAGSPASERGDDAVQPRLRGAALTATGPAAASSFLHATTGNPLGMPGLCPCITAGLSLPRGALTQRAAGRRRSPRAPSPCAGPRAFTTRITNPCCRCGRDAVGVPRDRAGRHAQPRRGHRAPGAP